MIERARPFVCWAGKLCAATALFTGLLGCSLTLAQTQAEPSAPPTWYDAEPLLRSLQPSARSQLLTEAQADDASALPLYELELELSDDLRTLDIDETLWLTHRGTRAWSEIPLRIFANIHHPSSPPVSVNSVSCSPAAERCSASFPTPDTLLVNLARPLEAGERIRIRLRARVTLPRLDPARTTMAAQSLESLGTLSGGHGNGDYGLLCRSEGVASLGSFVPVLARRRDDGWVLSNPSTHGDLVTDELAHYRATVRHARGVRVVATGVERAVRGSTGRAETHIDGAFLREFALVAGSRLRSHERSVGSVRVRSFFFGDRSADGARSEAARQRSASARVVLEAASRSLRLFSRRFGSYPYRQLDVAEAPLVGGAGGVEFSGLMTVATMFYRPANPGSSPGLLAALMTAGAGGDTAMETRRLSTLEMVTAHEVAHQWWHGIVGSDSRAHPFVDETLAQYSALLYFEDRYGGDRMEVEAERQVAATYHMMRLLGREDGPVDRPARAFSDRLAYGGIIYGKGPFVYRALRRQLGDQAFFAAIGAHARAHRFRTAPPRALFNRLASGDHADAVRAIERRWLEQTHGDADLGAPDLGRLMGGAAGQGSNPLEGLLGSLSADEDGGAGLLRALLGSLGGGGGSGPGASDLEGLLRSLRRSGDGSEAPAQVDGLLEMLEGTLR